MALLVENPLALILKVQLLLISHFPLGRLTGSLLWRSSAASQETSRTFLNK